MNNLIKIYLLLLSLFLHLISGSAHATEPDIELWNQIVRAHNQNPALFAVEYKGKILDDHAFVISITTEKTQEKEDLFVVKLHNRPDMSFHGTYSICVYKDPSSIAKLKLREKVKFSGTIFSIQREEEPLGPRLGIRIQNIILLARCQISSVQ